MKTFRRYYNEHNNLRIPRLLLCGGAAGHLQHVFEDFDLTFSELKDIIKQTLKGSIEIVEKCLDGNTIVIVDGKKLKISDVVDNNIGEKILAYDISKDDFIEKRIINRYNNGNQDDWIEIELENGCKLNLTPNHRVYTKDRGYVKAEELTETDELILWNKVES